MMDWFNGDKLSRIMNVFHSHANQRYIAEAKTFSDFRFLKKGEYLWLI